MAGRHEEKFWNGPLTSVGDQLKRAVGAILPTMISYNSFLRSFLTNISSYALWEVLNYFLEQARLNLLPYCSQNLMSKQLHFTWVLISPLFNWYTLIICDCLCINRPFTANIEIQFLHHPLTELLLIMTMVFFFPHDLLFSSYMTVSVIQLKKYISTNVRFHFRICTPCINSARTNRFLFDEYIQS